MEVDGATGDLLLRVGEETIRQHAPVTYQETASGGRREVESRYALRDDGQVGFEVGEYDRSVPLVIDPVLEYSTFLGDVDNEAGNGIAVDSAGNAYVTGWTESENFPTVDPIQGTHTAETDDKDVFVTKINSAGTALVYSTFLGGSGADTGTSIAVDSAGNAYVTGGGSVTFPTTAGAFDTTYNGGEEDVLTPDEVFVTKISEAPTSSTVQFSSASYSVQEDCTSLTITVNRSGDTSAAASVEYFTSNGTASERGDYITALGRIRFAAGETSKTFMVLINEDSYVEGDEGLKLNLSNSVGVSLGVPKIATINITDDATEPSENVIDDSRNFVCQNYHDFLNRQPDADGWDFRTNEITSCGADPQCVDIKRTNVSAAFFLEFVQRGRFVTAFPTTMTPAEFVDKLNQNAGNVLSASERTTAINLFAGLADSSNTTARAQAVRQVAEDGNLQAAELNRAFVLMEYLGYLRRNPNDPQDTDHTGYDFWLTQLNQFNGDYLKAEMVRAFIISIEYRQRFGGAMLSSTPTPTPTPTTTPTTTPTPSPSPTPSPGTLVVTNTNNVGAGSLRQAVLDANAASGANTITFDPSVFSAPQTIVLAGSVLTISDTLTITGPGANLLTVSGNDSVRVFAISPGVTASISGMKVTQGNSSTGAFPGFGGGIYNSTRDTLNVINCTISNNVADSDNTGGGTGGGGLYSTSGGVLTVTNSTITGNSVGGNAAAGGGGITSYGSATINNSTISGNSSGVNGGGILKGNGTVTLTNSTVVNNTAARDGGGVSRNSSGTFTMGNTIVANNTDDGTAPDFNGTVNSTGYNLIENTTGATITGTTTGNLTGVDPNLGPLQDNGGATQTHALLSGSPAIDQGESFNSTTDQRGLTRPFDNPSVPNSAGGNGSDIGAFEVQQFSAATLTTDMSDEISCRLAVCRITWPTHFIPQEITSPMKAYI